ncbi:hypothetical protein CSUI_008167 [Cystoisospora suis]|uniref:Uncharacterized protein n=1 Tax=Cystoisospora suis TaxID=483139 RepID=A0A2C6KN17_9APIC|nr:hypothetical protein CSUI_008167 [Cystoisospora suis]
MPAVSLLEGAGCAVFRMSPLAALRNALMRAAVVRLTGPGKQPWGGRRTEVLLRIESSGHYMWFHYNPDRKSRSAPEVSCFFFGL